MALYCCVVPNGTEDSAGVTVMAVSVRLVTVKLAVALCPPLIAAVIVVWPMATPVANPVLPIFATEFLEEVHVAVAVRSFVDPSL